jgi:hypothetical protein
MSATHMKTFLPVVKAVKMESTEQNWVNIFSDLRNRQTDVPNFNEISGFV